MHTCSYIQYRYVNVNMHVYIYTYLHVHTYICNIHISHSHATCNSINMYSLYGLMYLFRKNDDCVSKV